MEARYAIRQARTDELEALQAIEVEAATLFEDTRHADAVQGDATTLADLGGPVFFSMDGSGYCAALEITGDLRVAPPGWPLSAR